jgi:hypothetical protein
VCLSTTRGVESIVALQIRGAVTGAHQLSARAAGARNCSMADARRRNIRCINTCSQHTGGTHETRAAALQAPEVAPLLLGVGETAVGAVGGQVDGLAFPWLVQPLEDLRRGDGGSTRGCDVGFRG